MPSPPRALTRWPLAAAHGRLACVLRVQRHPHALRGRARVRSVPDQVAAEHACGLACCRVVPEHATGNVRACVCACASAAELRAARVCDRPLAGNSTTTMARANSSPTSSICWTTWVTSGGRRRSTTGSGAAQPAAAQLLHSPPPLLTPPPRAAHAPAPRCSTFQGRADRKTLGCYDQLKSFSFYKEHFDAKCAKASDLSPCTERAPYFQPTAGGAATRAAAVAAGAAAGGGGEELVMQITPNRPAPGLGGGVALVLGAAGASCDVACSTQGRACDSKQLQRLAHCGTLREYMRCPGTCGFSSEVAAVVLPGVLAKGDERCAACTVFAACAMPAVYVACSAGASLCCACSRTVPACCHPPRKACRAAPRMRGCAAGARARSGGSCRNVRVGIQ